MLRIEDIKQDNFKDIPNPCKYCLYWQTTGDYGEGILTPENEKEKRQWFEQVTEKCGSCMKVAYLNEAPIGFVQYAPARFFPRVKEYVSGPLAENAILITCLYIVDRKARGRGIGPDILRKLLSDLRQKGVETVETFAGKGSANTPSGPLKLYLKHGFKVKNEKDDFLLVRLES